MFKSAAVKLDPIAPMKLKKVKDPKEALEKHPANALILQQKIDGFKTQSIKSDGVRLYTRRGEEFSANVPELVKELNSKMESGDFWLGELAYIKNGKQSISDIQTIVGSSPEKAQKHDGGKIVFYVYDFLWAGGKDITKTPYIDRYNKLKSKMGKGTAHIELVKNYSWGELDKALDDAIKAGGEGIVLKPKTSHYEYGSKGSSEKIGGWVKFKPGAKARETDVILNSYTKSEKKLVFPMYKYRAEKLVEVGKISGMSKDEEAKLKKAIDAGKSVVVQVSYQEETKDKKLRHAGWIRSRPDKSPKEVKMAVSKKLFLSKRAAEEAKSVVVLIEENPKIKSDVHSICEHSGGHRDTVSIINFLRNMLGKEVVSFSDGDLKEYIESVRKKYQKDLQEPDVDAGLVGLDDTKHEDNTADYIEHGKASM
jgi:ATP-dependent DNA ligase